MKPRLQLKQTSSGQATVAIKLTGLITAEADDGPKWVQVTREGNFPGYLGGLRPFAFTKRDLQAMVDNLHAHPSFERSEAGVATGRVIPWDFNHASEQDPTSGDLPVIGAPARAWTLDLELRNGADGMSELWALTEFMEPARTYVRAGQYQWASVAVTFNAIKQETGQNIGALITSIALTNTPFVEGMAKLAASKQSSTAQASAVAASVSGYYSPAKTVGEAIASMRCMFGLPETAGAAEVLMQVSIVQQWLTNGTAPLGTDPAGIIGCLRTILNLPALSADLEVLQEAGKSIQRLLEEQATASGVPSQTATPGGGMVPPPPVAASRQKDTRAMEELIKILASLLGVRQSEDAVREAVKEIVQLRDGLKEVFSLRRDGSDVILGAAKDATAAKEKLMGLFTALGVENPDAAVAKVAQVMQSAAQLKEVMPELEGLRADKAKTEEAAVESDVDSAIAACKLHPSVRPALVLLRKQDPKTFAATYPKGAAATGAASHKHLLTAAPTAAPVQQTHGADVINLAMFPGANATARARAYLAGTVANWDKLTNDDQFLRAVNLRKQPNVIDQATS